MTHILHRQIAGALPVAAGGTGIEIVDSTGKRYIDASGAAAVSCLGHGHPAVTAALHEQLDKLAYAHTGFFTTEVAEKLADRLIADAPKGMSHAYLVSGGSEAIGAVLLGRHIYDPFANGSGFFQHGHTYVGHPMACAAGLAVQETIRRDNLLANVRTMGVLLQRRLREHFGNHPQVGDICGRGLFQAVELVEDRSTKAPFDPTRKLDARIKKAAMARGLMVYPMGGTIDGQRGDHVLLAPPFIVTADQIGEIVDRLGSAIEDALA